MKGYLSTHFQNKSVFFIVNDVFSVIECFSNTGNVAAGVVVHVN